MAWELHNGKPVYYRSRRKGKKVTREYYGSGDLATTGLSLGRRQTTWKATPR